MPLPLQQDLAVRHRIDGLENRELCRPYRDDVRHRIDGLENIAKAVTVKSFVRHRIDGLEILTHCD